MHPIKHSPIIALESVSIRRIVLEKGTIYTVGNGVDDELSSHDAAVAIGLGVAVSLPESGMVHLRRSVFEKLLVLAMVLPHPVNGGEHAA